MKAREKAYNLLCEIILNKQYSNLILRKELNDFEEQDKRFITNIVYGTMQNYLYVRYLWENYVEKSIAKDIAILMDMSIYQIEFMDKVRTYAVVNEAVEIASQLHKGKYKSMMNAMLRRFMREEKREITGDDLTQLSILTSHPLWLVKMWNKQYGYEVTKKICYDNQEVPTLACRVNTLKSSKSELLINKKFREGYLSKDALLYEGGNIANTKEFLEGLITIQDESIQCVALMVDPNENERVLDVCAAPGTKTTHMAQLMKNTGEIIACDIHEHRVELIHNSMKRMGLNCILPQQLDGTLAHESFEAESFDRILVDAPCSGYGVLKRKNDIKVHMEPSDMDEIIPLQASILESVSSLVKKEGILVYSTCTLNKKENEKQVENFLKNHEEYTLLEMRTIFPYEYHSDGFFMAKFKKI